jgi:hypothetical protein
MCSVVSHLNVAGLTYAPDKSQVSTLLSSPPWEDFILIPKANGKGPGISMGCLGRVKLKQSEYACSAFSTAR